MVGGKQGEEPGMSSIVGGTGRRAQPKGLGMFSLPFAIQEAFLQPHQVLKTMSKANI